MWGGHGLFIRSNKLSTTFVVNIGGSAPCAFFQLLTSYRPLRGAIKSLIILFFLSLFFPQLDATEFRFQRSDFLSPTIRSISLSTPVPDSIHIDERNLMTSHLRVFSGEIELEAGVDFILKEIPYILWT